MPDRDRADRADLAALVVPLGRALTAAELPALRAHGLTMWAYSVLLHLDAEPARTQSALARAIGADKSRIITVLDDLESRGLIRREPDPADRRARLLTLTPSGARLRAATQAEIRRNEDRVLSHLPPAERASFLHALQTLAALSPGEVTGQPEE